MWACQHGTAWPSQCEGVPTAKSPAVSTPGTEASNAWMAKEQARYKAECKRNPAGCPLGPNYMP